MLTPKGHPSLRAWRGPGVAAPRAGGGQMGRAAVFGVGGLCPLRVRACPQASGAQVGGGGGFQGPWGRGRLGGAAGVEGGGGVKAREEKRQRKRESLKVMWLIERQTATDTITPLCVFLPVC